MMGSHRLRWAGLALLLPVPVVAQDPVIHMLPATPRTVSWGYYWSEATPALRIHSGDIVEVETMITNRPAGLERAGVPPEDVQPALRAIVEGVTDRGPGGHILTGPIYVDGAEAGDVLEVRILSVGLPITYGYNGCSGYLRQNCGDQGTRIIHLDREKMTATFAPGIEVSLRPFFGSMGVAPPPDAGRWSSNPPWIHAGNLDNKELVAGTSLFIPVHVPGALFAVGDGHAAQGDGEVDQTAIETSLTGRLQFVVHKDQTLSWPRAETPTHYIAMGSDPDLNRATQIAVEQMIDLIMDLTDLERGAAYQLASIAADLRITQLVDGYVGVHMMLPKQIFSDQPR